MQNVGHVRLDRGLADTEIGRDFTIGFALADFLQNRKLAAGQALETGGQLGPLRARRVLAEARWHINIARHDFANDARKGGLLLGFGDEPDRPEADGLAHNFWVV